MKSHTGQQIELSRAPLIAKCPACNSENVTRESGGAGAGPMDRCEDCGTEWPHKPGTITGKQHIERTAAELYGDGDNDGD